MQSEALKPLDGTLFYIVQLMIRYHVCFAAGRRIDLETLSRAIPLWRSDYAGDPESAQVETMGLSHFAPISAGAVFGWDPYTWRSSGVVGKTISWGQRGWETLMANASALLMLKAAAEETRRIRPIALLGDYYALTAATYQQDSWAAYQFHCQTGCGAGPVGIAYLFRRPQATTDVFSLVLQNLESSALYNLTVSTSYSPDGPAVKLTGQQLQGWPVHLQSPGSSVLIEYTVVI